MIENLILRDFIIDIDEKHKNKKFLTRQDIAEILECDEKYVYNATRRRSISTRLPKIIIQKKVRYPKIAFYKWLEAEFYNI